jgi:hypothetical protein
MFQLLFFVSLFFTFNFKEIYMKPSNIPGRYTNILFPTESWDDFPNELWSYKLLLGPVTSFPTPNDFKDICSGFSEYNVSWNSPKPCETYFCSPKEPIYLERSKNGNLTSLERENAFLRHLGLHRFCTLCNQTAEENFKGNCTHFDGRFCHPGRCESGSECIQFNTFEVSTKRPFEERNSICFDFADNMFYYHSDFTHKVLFWFYYRYSLILSVLGYSLLTIFVTFGRRNL